MFDEYTSLHISDVTFFPSEHGRGYDLYASSSSKNEVLYINLASGKVEMIEGGSTMRRQMALVAHTTITYSIMINMIT